MNQEVAIFRKEHFNAAHRLHNPHWDDAKNLEVFGKCNNPNYHGHNYLLEIKVIGVPDATTGYVLDMKWLSNLIKKEILHRFDHRNLNLDCAEFNNINPTAENISIVIYNLLKPHLPSTMKLQVRLYETENNFVEYPAHL
jgi:6-pyruvoyltetrahydropterin/6-carboxytetrahydropterin synthase